MAKAWFKVGMMVGAFALANCGGTPPVPPQAIEGSGIVASFRDDNNVTILYQSASTTDARLKAEADRICGKIGKRSGYSQEANLSRAGRIPGVDARIIYRCV